MTSTAILGPAPPIDAALPELPAVLSAHPPGTAAGEDCRIRHVEWVPRRRCRVVQEVRSPGRTALLCYEVTPTGTTVRAPADDDDLPGLAVALDPDHVRDRLARLSGAPVGLCRITPVAYRPATRAVLAYDVVADSGTGRLYAKLLSDGSDRYAAATAAIAASALGHIARAPVPDVVAVWPDLGAVVQRGASGRALSDLLRDEVVPGADRLGHAAELGRLLAAVHGTPCAGQPRWSAEEELAALELLLPSACHADPAVGRSLAALVDRLADAVPADDDPVLCHGAFRTGQVVVDGGVLSLLDLDTVSCSDAARDAGSALAYLSWADVRRALRPGFAAAVQDAFLAGYAGGRGRLSARSLAWWSVATMAKIAGRRYRSLATAEWSDVPGLLRRAVTLLDTPGAAVLPGPRLLPAQPRVPQVDPLDVVRMTEILRAQPSLRTSDRARVVGARPLAEAAGRRRVVEYAVDGLGTDRPVPVIGKIYTDRHRSSMACQNLRLLGDEVFAASPRFGVPRLIGHLPALRMVLYHEVTGTPLDRLPRGAAVTTAGLVAGWLATLHGSGVVLARRVDLAHEIANAEAWAVIVGDRAPGARAAAGALAARLAGAAGDLPDVPEVPVHKDLHAGHVIAVGPGAEGGTPPGRVVVLDLDEARMGDPAIDLAHVAAYLAVAPRRPTRGARDAFVARYGPLRGPAPEARWAFWTAYTNLKIAKQLVTSRGPVSGPAGRLRRAVLTAALQRGLACLDG